MADAFEYTHHAGVAALRHKRLLLIPEKTMLFHVKAHMLCITHTQPVNIILGSSSLHGAERKKI
jgi:hypothetical protein